MREARRVRGILERVLADEGFSPVAIGRSEGLALQTWVLTERAQRTLETGLGYGIATLFICEGLIRNGSNDRHVAVDPYQHTGLPGQTTRFRGRGLALLEEAGVRQLVEFYEEESEIVLPRLLAAGRVFDLAFLDGNHRFEGIFLDLIYSGRLLREGGIVFVDDAQLPGVQRAIDFCTTNLGWAIEDRGADGSEHQWLVLRTGSPELFRRPFADFVDF
jgi:predicted O-methyltransferase YrrM